MLGRFAETKSVREGPVECPWIKNSGSNALPLDKMRDKALGGVQKKRVAGPSYDGARGSNREAFFPFVAEIKVGQPKCPRQESLAASVVNAESWNHI